MTDEERELSEKRAGKAIFISEQEKLEKEDKKKLVEEIESEKPVIYTTTFFDNAFIAGRIIEYEYYDLMLKWWNYVSMKERNKTLKPKEEIQ